MKIFRPILTAARSITTSPSNAIVPGIQRRASQQFQKLNQTNKVSSVILDWSGTTADKYVFAPAVVFKAIFEVFGVNISMHEARMPMGLRKDLHIAAITKIPEVQKRWELVYGRPPKQVDVDNMFKKFVPLQLEVLPKYTDLIPGTLTAVKELRNMCIKIGHTTGFNEEMVAVLLADAKKQGYEPDVSVAGDTVLHGARPGPHMIFKNMDLLGENNLNHIVKVDDTVTGIGEGLSARCWTVAVSKYSNYVFPNLEDIEQVAEVSTDEVKACEAKSREILLNSGAHYVINDISQLPQVVAHINFRLQNGERPTDESHYQFKVIKQESAESPSLRLSA